MDGIKENKENKEIDPAVLLANAHWDYIQGLLTVHELPSTDIKRIRYHYKTAFIHGFKHGVEHQSSFVRMVNAQ